MMNDPNFKTEVFDVIIPNYYQDVKRGFIQLPSYLVSYCVISLWRLGCIKEMKDFAQSVMNSVRSSLVSVRVLEISVTNEYFS